MYRGNKISVAIATYNGEKYVKEQLNSIIDQTVPVDEIVISDDGSNDNTLNVISQLAAINNQNISFLILTDNVNHGPRGNFENALFHCTGDFIFLADQDDIWYREKVEKIMNVFLQNHDAHLVCHEAILIDKHNGFINGIFNERLARKLPGLENDSYIKLTKNSFLDMTVSGPLTNGMVMCISKWLKDQSLPFPKAFASHDWWLGFLAVKNDSCYYLNSVLTKYRLHGDNTTGNKAYTGNLLNKIQKGIGHVKKIKTNSVQTGEFYNMSKAVRNRLDRNDDTEKQAYEIANRICDISHRLIEIERSGRIEGCVKLISLYKNDIRYRNSGKNAFLLELLYILVNSKNKRAANLKTLG